MFYMEMLTSRMWLICIGQCVYIYLYLKPIGASFREPNVFACVLTVLTFYLLISCFCVLAFFFSNNVQFNAKLYTQPNLGFYP